MENEQTPGQAPVSPKPNQKVLPAPSDILKEAWAIYKNRFETILGITVIPSLLLFLFSDSMLLSDLESKGVASAILLTLGLLAVVIIGQAWSQIALVIAVKDPGAPGAKESFQKGWRMILSYWWVNILTALIVLLGFILLIVPGIIFAVWYSLAVFIYIAEGIKGRDALRKSKEYVKGKGWAVFWRFLFIGIIVILISILASALFSSLHLPFSDDVAAFLIGVFLTPLVVVYSYLLYTKVKEAREQTPIIAG